MNFLDCCNDVFPVCPVFGCFEILYYKSQQITKFKRFSSRLTVVFNQSSEAKC